MNKSNEWLTQKEAAEYMKMALGTFRNYTSKGFFKYYVHPKTGTKRFRTSDLDAEMVKKPSKQKPRG